MVSPAPVTRPVAPSAGQRFEALLRAMLDGWLAHHARLAELRIGGL